MDYVGNCCRCVVFIVAAAAAATCHLGADPSCIHKQNDNNNNYYH